MNNDSLTLIGGTLNNLALPNAGVAPSRVNQLAVRGGFIVQGVVVDNALSWASVLDMRDFLFPFTDHTFTSAGVSGANGPSLAQLRSAYSQRPWATNTSLFNVSGGIQTFAIPVTGRYLIEAYGGSRCAIDSGGVTNLPVVSAQFDLQKGDVIRILVGQAGENVRFISGGGGGTYVTSAQLGLLLVAGGEGGAGSGYVASGALITARLGGPSVRNTTSTPPSVSEGATSPGASFTSGNISAGAGGGGGYLTASYVLGSGQGRSYADGGAGGTITTGTANCAGGFGGGGAGSWRANTSYHVSARGGGGGYTGGGAGFADSTSVSQPGRGGQGGCFVADFATNIAYTARNLTSAFNGQLKLTLLS